MAKSNSLQKKSLVVRALDSIERAGNALPSPATIFLVLTIAVMIISAICANLGVSVTYETIDTANGNAIVETTVSAVNLLSVESIRTLITKMVTNFTSFFALGTVFTIILGVSVADGSGMLSALLRKAATSAPRSLVTAMVVFLGIMSNIASSTGYVVLVPLGAILFMAFGRHPIAGLAAAFAGVSGGWSANLLIGTNDPMFAGMSTQAANMLDPNYVVSPLCNWFFMFASTFVVTAIGTFVTDKIVEPRLGKYEGAIEGAKQQPDRCREARPEVRRHRRSHLHRSDPDRRGSHQRPAAQRDRRFPAEPLHERHHLHHDASVPHPRHRLRRGRRHHP